MAKTTPYLFCKYEISIADDPLSSREQEKLFAQIKGRPIAHRVRDPSPDDATTFLMKPRLKKVGTVDVLTWSVADQIGYRELTRYDKTKDDEFSALEETDEIRRTKFIAVPSLGALAVEDRISERTLGARSAVSRFIALCAKLAKADARVVYAGTSQDVQKALDTWDLERFTFTVRPFNPTIRKPGDKLDELLKSDHVGVMQGVAFPSGEASMKDSHEGLIAETKGLTDHGYGQIGATGTTPEGFRAALSKPKFDMDKVKNKERQAANRTLKVYIPTGDSISEEEACVVKALIEMYG
jgi:hypothetical protein